MLTDHSTSRDLIAILVCLTIFLLNALLEVATGFVGLSILTVALIVVLYPHASTSLGLIALFTGITVFAVPLMALIYVDAGIYPGWLGLFIIVARAMIHWAPPAHRVEADAGMRAFANLVMMALLQATSLALLALEYNELFFHGGFACSLIHLERLHASTESKVVRLAGVTIALLAILVFALVFWTGFGRIVLSTFALAAVIISIHYGTFRVPVLTFCAFSASLLFIGRVMRFGVSDGIAGLADDSGASPMTLTQAFWDSRMMLYWNEPFWHQWSLVFISWYPRAWWPEKPIGLNYSLVDAIWGRQQLGAEHSTAVSFLGEQIFLHGSWWPVTTALIVTILLLIMRAAGKIAFPYFAPIIIVQVWLISFFWGGMALYGTRIWYSLVPMLAYAVILQQFLKVRTPQLPRAAVAR